MLIREPVLLLHADSGQLSRAPPSLRSLPSPHMVQPGPSRRAPPPLVPRPGPAGDAGCDKTLDEDEAVASGTDDEGAGEPK